MTIRLGRLSVTWCRFTPARVHFAGVWKGICGSERMILANCGRIEAEWRCR